MKTFFKKIPHVIPQIHILILVSAMTIVFGILMNNKDNISTQNPPAPPPELLLQRNLL